MKSFSCSSCGAGPETHAHDRFEVRLEVRSLYDRSRERTKKVSEVCRRCIPAALGETPDRQEALL